MTVRDVQKLGAILDATVRVGANTINGIQFDASDKEKATSEARKLAVESARSQAEELAKYAGVQLGNVLTLNATAQDAQPPVYYAGATMARAAGDSAVPVATGQLLVSVEAHITFEIK